MLNRYITFIFGFMDRNQIVDFINDNVGKNDFYVNKKYIIDNNTLIFIFDTDIKENNLKEKLKETVTNSKANYFFLFDINTTIYGLFTDKKISDFLISNGDNKLLDVIYQKVEEKEEILDLDDILEKINLSGKDSLTEKELEYLKNL